ncbi:MAG: chromophore lyase CpcT/CpeT [Pseudomonadota bacterium]
MSKFLLAFVVLLLGTPLAAQPSEQADLKLGLEEQLAVWLEWFPGRYDSFEQTHLQVQAGLPEDARNYRRHSVFRRVELPFLAGITFYAEQRRWLEGTGFEGEVYRQRIYSVTLDEERQAIRLRVHVPREQNPLLGAYVEPTRLAALSPDDLAVWPGCDVFWNLEGGHFIGRLDAGACRFTSPAYGQEIQLEEYLLLSQREIHFADRGLSMAGEYLFGMRGDTPTIAVRARGFVCDVTDDMRLGDRRNIPTHDQGGLVLLDTPLEDGTAPLRMRLSVIGGALRLDLLAAGVEGEPLARASAPPDAEIIGLELGGIAVQCRHDPQVLFAN